MRSWLRRLAPRLNRLFGSPLAKIFIPAAVLAAAVWLIHRELQEVQLGAIITALQATPIWTLALAAGFTAASYACLAMVEWRALTFMGHPQPPLPTALRSFAVNSLSSLVGFGLASGTALRLRAYASARLSAAEIARLVFLYTAATYLTGVVCLGLSTLAAIRPISAALSLPAWAVAFAGLVLLGPAALWFLLFKEGRRGSAAADQIERAAALGAGIGDWLFSGAALFVLTSDQLTALPAFLAVFCLGSLLGGLAGVPGGIGVLEATVLGLHAGSLPHATAAALILYRAIYLLGPAAVTVLVLAARRLLGVGRA